MSIAAFSMKFKTLNIKPLAQIAVNKESVEALIPNHFLKRFPFWLD